MACQIEQSTRLNRDVVQVDMLRPRGAIADCQPSFAAEELAIC